MEKPMRSEGRYRLVLAAVLVLVVAAVLIGGWYGRQGEGMDNAASGLNFVNARISEEDVQKYGLRELWKRHDPYFYEGLDPFAGGGRQWTVDDQSGAFLLLVSSGGREDPGLLKFVMRWQSKDYVAMMRIGSGGSKDFSKVPYVRYWDLQELKGPGNREDALNVLRAAMTVYGVVGLRHQFEELELHFNF